MSFSPWEGCLPELDWCVPCGGGTATYVALLPSAAQSETVITVNQGLRGGKVVELKKTVDQAVKQCPGVKGGGRPRAPAAPLGSAQVLGSGQDGKSGS